MKINTTVLQEMVAKAVKGAGNNKLIPMTTMVYLQLKDGTFTIVTTDATNYLYVNCPMEGEDLYTVVKVEQFAKLVSKLTTEETTLTVKSNYLEVVADGTYKIAIEPDVDGEVVKFNDPLDGVTDLKQIGWLTKNTIDLMLNSLKPALAVTSERPQYKNYFMGDVILATDTFKINVLNTKAFDTPILVSTELGDLLDVFNTDEDVEVMMRPNNYVKITTPSCTVYGPVDVNTDSFNITAIKGCTNLEYKNHCTLDKATLLQALDRLSLFVGEFDAGAIDLVFSANELQMASKESSGVEIIPYVAVDSSDGVAVDGIISIDRLKAQIKAQSGNTVEMFFEQGKPLKMVDTNIGLTSVVALEA